MMVVFGWWTLTFGNTSQWRAVLCHREVWSFTLCSKGVSQNAKRPRLKVIKSPIFHKPENKKKFVMPLARDLHCPHFHCKTGLLLLTLKIQQRRHWFRATSPINAKLSPVKAHLTNGNQTLVVTWTFHRQAQQKYWDTNIWWLYFTAPASENFCNLFSASRVWGKRLNMVTKNPNPFCCFFSLFCSFSISGVIPNFIRKEQKRSNSNRQTHAQKTRQNCLPAWRTQRIFGILSKSQKSFHFWTLTKQRNDSKMEKRLSWFTPVLYVRFYFCALLHWLHSQKVMDT